MAGKPFLCSVRFLQIASCKSGFQGWGVWAAIQVWKWNRLDCLTSADEWSKGTWQKKLGVEREASQLQRVFFFHPCQLLFYSSDLCASVPPTPLVEWISLMVFFLSTFWKVGWSGMEPSRERGEVEQIGKRTVFSSCHLVCSCPFLLEPEGRLNGWIVVFPMFSYLATFMWHCHLELNTQKSHPFYQNKDFVLTSSSLQATNFLFPSPIPFEM